MAAVALSRVELWGLTLPWPHRKGTWDKSGYLLLSGENKGDKGARTALGTRHHAGVVKGNLWLILDDSQASLHHGVRGKDWGTVRGSRGMPSDRKLLVS